jgi:succinoglycan biosynthesis protein ExoA
LAHSSESYIYSDYEGWVSPISVAVVYHKSVFEDAGCFDEKFDAAEDLEFNYRLEKAGYKCFLSPKLKVYYYPRESIKSLFKQTQRYGLGRAAFILKHPERFTLNMIVPAVFVLALIGLPIVSLFIGTASIFILFLLAYFTILSLESVRINRAHGTKYLILIPMIIATIHMGMGSGFLKRLFKLGRR